MRMRKDIWINGLILSALLFGGCAEMLDTDSETQDLATATNALSRMDGEMTLDIVYSGQSERSLVLYVGGSQYGLTSAASNGSCAGSTTGGNYAVSCTWTEDYDSETDTDDYTDHPFVNHPDDWDHVKIRNTDGTAVSVSQISLGLSKRGIDSTDNFGTPFYFVDEAFTTPVSISPSNDLVLDDTIRANRECIARSTLCGVDAVSCAADADPCTRINAAEGGNLTVGDIDLDERLPRMALKQIEDIGQPGSKKVSLFSYSSPCTETYTYYAQQYANGFYTGCEESLYGKECLLFPTLDSDAVSSTFLQADKLYKAVFNYDASGARVSFKGFFKCLQPAPGDPDICMDADKNVPYQPKAGDMFRRHDRARRKCKSNGNPDDRYGNQGHTDQLFDGNGNGVHGLSFAVNGTTIRDYDATHVPGRDSGHFLGEADPNGCSEYDSDTKTCGAVLTPCNSAEQSAYRYDYFVGDIDHEKKENGNFGMESTLLAIIN